MATVALAALVLPVLLSMSSSDEDEVGAIWRAQAVARARNAAQPVQATVNAPVLEAHAELFEELRNDELRNDSLAGHGSAGGKRKTCAKDKLPVKCRQCTNSTRKPCDYKAGQWDPPNSTTSHRLAAARGPVPAQPRMVGSAVMMLA